MSKRARSPLAGKSMPEHSVARVITERHHNDPVAIFTEDDKLVVAGIFMEMREVRSRRTGAPVFFFKVARCESGSEGRRELRRLLNHGQGLTLVVSSASAREPFFFQTRLRYCSARHIYLNVRPGLLSP